MDLIFRDDDICFFTEKKDLEKIYGGLWDKGIKICLSTIPFVNSGIKANENFRRMGFEFDPLIPNGKGGKGYFSIAKNKHLCSFLNKKIEEGLVEITMHGFSHGLHPVEEFNSGNIVGLQKKLNKGMQLLQEAFPGAKIKTFVAPYGKISNEAKSILLENKFNACIDSSSIFAPVFIKKGNNYIFQKSNFIFNPFLGNCTAERCSEKASFFMKKTGKKGLAIIANHYWEFDIVPHNEKKLLLNNWLAFSENIINAGTIKFTSFNSFSGLQ